MFWLYLLCRPRRRHHHVHIHLGAGHARPPRKHARFCNVWYWLSGLALMELLAWYAAGELLGMWWLLWWVARKAVFLVGDHRSVPGAAYRMIDATRPVWPKPAPAA
jgi:hypothetical protein